MVNNNVSVSSDTTYGFIAKFDGLSETYASLEEESIPLELKGCNVYINGELKDSFAGSLPNTQPDYFIVGGRLLTSDPSYAYVGNILDFRVFAGAITPTEISDIYAIGPNFFSVSVYTHILDLSWNSVPGASRYTIVMENVETGYKENILNESHLLHNKSNESRNYIYIFSIY